MTPTETNTPLISPERAIELLSYLPKPRNLTGAAWSNADHLTAAKVVYAVLQENGVWLTDIRDVAHTLSRISLP